MKNRNLKIDGMLMATFITTLFYSSTFPYIHKGIISSINDSFISIERIINCLGIITSGFIWNKFSNKLFKFYPVYCAAETIFNTTLTVFALTTYNLIVYYIMDAIIYAVVTRNICCGGVKLRAIRYNTEESREKFDNNDNSIYAIATILGSVIAIFLNLNFKFMLILATIGNTIDNIFYVFIYYNERYKKRKNKEA